MCCTTQPRPSETRVAIITWTASYVVWPDVIKKGVSSPETSTPASTRTPTRWTLSTAKRIPASLECEGSVCGECAPFETGGFENEMMRSRPLAGRRVQKDDNREQKYMNEITLNCKKSDFPTNGTAQARDMYGTPRPRRMQGTRTRRQARHPWLPWRLGEAHIPPDHRRLTRTLCVHYGKAAHCCPWGCGSLLVSVTLEWRARASCGGCSGGTHAGDA